MRLTKPLPALLAMALLLVSAGTGAADPLVIRQGWVALTNVLSPIVFDKRDILKHYGESYVLEPTHFAGTSPEVQALAAGEMDIITIGFSTLAAAVQNARMEDIRIISDGFQDGVGDFYSSQYFVRNDSPIKTIEDLKGKVLVSNGIGGSLDVALRAMMRKHHMEDRKDFTLIESEFATMNSMLLERKVDLVGVVPPFSYDPKLRQNAHPLFSMKDAVGQTQMIMLAARSRFLEKNRPALNDFFEDMLRGLHWFLDPANRDAAIAVVARVTKQPPERVAGYIFTKGDYFRDPDGRPNLAALQHDMHTQRELGLIKADLDVQKYTDLSFVDEAARRIKQEASAAAPH